MLDTSRCVEQMNAAVAFATERGLLAQLREKLDWLDGFNGGRDRVVLSPDHAPHSFGFRIYRLTKLDLDPETAPEDAWRFLIEGGLIYFGPGDTGAGAPALSVRFGEDLNEGWSIHS